MDLPVSLRRARRTSAAYADSHSTAIKSGSSCCLTATPRKRGRPKKHVRFSDPGPSLGSSSSPAATGLTPMIRRTSLSAPAQRRHSTPSRPANGAGLDLDSPSVPLSGEVTFLPLRQVLDGRVKRRIRRNGLSEEMNLIHAEKKRRAAETRAEIEQLKAELAAKDAEIEQLQTFDDTVAQDTGRIIELERQVDELRQQLENKSGSHDKTYDWTMAARDPFAEDYTMMDLNSDPMDADNEDDFGETTMADLHCSTPTRRNRAISSFPSPPLTSPTTMPMTPSSHCRTPRSHAGVQVAMLDTEKQQIEEELASLQLEISKLTGTLESYQSLTDRLASQLSGVPQPADLPSSDEQQTNASSPKPDLERHLKHALQSLSDRTAALLALSSSLSELGFPGSDASEIVTSLSTAFRTARLELEYLTPGEVALPLTSAGAEVLDLLLNKLRDLARKSKEADDEIDEYHEMELSLRKQLGARVEAMDGLVREVNRLEAEAKAKDEKISDLELGVDRLKGAVASYTRDVSELERLVERIEGDLQNKVTEATKLSEEKEQQVQAHLEAAKLKDETIVEFERKLAEAVTQTESLLNELSSAQDEHQRAKEKHQERLTSLNKSHGQALALRDARVSELREEVDRVNSALRSAHETVRQLRVENSGLEKKLEDEKTRARAAIDAVKAELERVARMGQEFLAQTPKKNRETRASLSLAESAQKGGAAGQGLLGGDLARRKSGAGKKRRRYDSGLGFLDEEEVDAEY
ncbi:uncharacterized protein E0L32_010200 [Thyridium curvatum]|uniref:Uncharacterized protein n=1 Tax=Thyridium curvatum TaxID=1093900 RepID=A0A507AKV8_9PEZI|nr:uncharacterized protein E0L32_010200 [Thyridium curvatum]TPX08133.1 hypothetical protein E0L32_010200 [Thyridium curvatum]